MKDAQIPGHVSLVTLVDWLREGRYVIPDFQREFEWKPSDIRELVRSIFLDYYIGSLLIWKGKPENFDALSCEPIYGYRGNQDNPLHIVLDGQQRLTAIYYSFFAPNIRLPNKGSRYLYFIRVDKLIEENYDEAFEYDWTRKGVNILENQVAQFEQHYFPVSVIGQGGWNLGNWVQGYEKHWRNLQQVAQTSNCGEADQEADRHANNAVEFGNLLKAIVEKYQISYIELDRDLEIDKVCDIFTQVNSRGIRLDIFDLMNAMLKPKGLQLKHLWRRAAPRLEFVDSGRMNVYILQVMSILRQTYCSPKYLYYLLPGQQRQVRGTDGSLRKDVLVPDVTDFERRWNEAVKAVECAIKLLRDPREFGAISSRFLPYVSILPAFAALQTCLGKLSPTSKLDARRKLHHWYWASVFTNRYSGAVESTSARDFMDVRDWFNNDTAKPGLIDEFHSRFRSLDLHKENKRGTSAYNGIFNLLVLRGARDWITGNSPQHDDLDDHHIVPKSWGKENDLAGDIDTILNRTPLTTDTNRNVIGEQLPNEYIPKLIEASGETNVRATLETHLISPEAFDILLRNPFTTSDFRAFTSERQRTLQGAIEDLLVKERLDLPPPLRDLDAKIENVELALRGRINTALEGKYEHLPNHVIQKIEERLQTAMRKNLALGSDHYKTLLGKLEYTDLRELKDIVMNKNLWEKFQPFFVNKETLEVRFGQFAELRNCIRHSRHVGEVTRKEGEAAILWFENKIE